MAKKPVFGELTKAEKREVNRFIKKSMTAYKLK